jgi:cell division protein FtsB
LHPRRIALDYPPISTLLGVTMNNFWAILFKISLGVVILVSVIGVLYIFIPEYARMTELRQKKEELLLKNTDIENRIHDYQNRQIQFQTDPRFVERLVREQFGMVRESETIYKVIHDAPKVGPVAPDGK